MNTTLLTVFAVIMSCGKYEDHFSSVLRIFTKRADADRFVARKNDDASEARGMIRASNALIAEWELSHPCPENYSDSSYGAWSEAKYAESTRLDTLIGIDAAFEKIKLDRYRGEDATFYVEEVKQDGSPYDDD